MTTGNGSGTTQQLIALESCNWCHDNGQRIVDQGILLLSLWQEPYWSLRPDVSIAIAIAEVGSHLSALSLPCLIAIALVCIAIAMSHCHCFVLVLDIFGMCSLSV